jgi:hypothetical protein
MSINVTLVNQELFNIPDFRNLNIKNIWLDMNKISKIEKLPNTVNRLFIRSNNIEKLENLPEELEELWICDNKISVIENLPASLKKLYINNNNVSNIVSLPENIEIVQIYNNPIKQIPDWILNCENLRIFSVNENVVVPQEFKSLLESRRMIMNNNQNNLTGFPNNLTGFPNETTDFPNNLTDFPNETTDFPNNLTYFPNETTDFPNEFDDDDYMYFEELDDTKLKIYNDGENVHDTSIQSSLSLSINNILKGPCFGDEMKQLLNDSSLSSEIICYILESFKEETIHAQTGVTYEKLFGYVFYYILNSENCDELIKILEDEIHEGRGLCFVGRLTRLVNVLSGFHDGVTLKIADNSQIGNIAVLLRSNYSGEELRTNFRKEMRERGYSNDIIDEWIEYL